jgi:AraC family transcriptional regulator
MIAPQVLQRIGAEINASEVMLKPLLNLEDTFVTGAILALEADVRQGSPLGPIYGETIATALMTHLVHECAGIAPERLNRPTLNADVATKVRDYIEAHFAEPILLGDLASLAGIEIHKVTRAFKKSFGIAPHRYILRTRIARAKAMLRRHDMSLVDVALSTGFSNQSHFTKAFKKLTGLSPSNYRRSVD